MRKLLVFVFAIVGLCLLGCTPAFHTSPTIHSMLSEYMQPATELATGPVGAATAPATSRPVMSPSATSPTAILPTAILPTTYRSSVTTQPTKAELLAAVDRGVEFLIKSQNEDGSWGTGTKTTGFEVFSMVPGSHDAYRIATTALCVMALREAGEKKAHDKGLEYLITTPEARRDDGLLIYNVWAHLYQLQALSEELAISTNPQLSVRIRDAAKRSLQSMVRYSTVVGGWNYYDFQVQGQTPSMGPTSFGSAAGLVAFYEARNVGIELPDKLTRMTVRRLEECRLPGGMFMYGSDYKYHPWLPANMEKGSVGRTQPSYYALWLWNSPVATVDRIRLGLQTFDRDHDYLQMGRKRPIPHESWYQTAGYYYYYDHYYAARLLEALPLAERKHFAHVIISGIMQYQEPDGSWWDFPMWDYHKPYGTAFSIMALLRCREE